MIFLATAHFSFGLVASGSPVCFQVLSESCPEAVELLVPLPTVPPSATTIQCLARQV